MGIKSGDKIALISNNRTEWNTMDIETLQPDSIHVAVYSNYFKK